MEFYLYMRGLVLGRYGSQLSLFQATAVGTPWSAPNHFPYESVGLYLPNTWVQNHQVDRYTKLFIQGTQIGVLNS